MGIAALIGLVFLLLFSLLHLLSHLSRLRFPLLASSESVWEHLKMAFWAYTGAYGILWAFRPTATLPGLFSGSVMVVALLFAMYYTLGVLVGPGLHARKGLYIAVIVPLTFVAGWTAAGTSLSLEKSLCGLFSVLVWALAWALLAFLFTVYTYTKPHIELFTLRRLEP